jgi:hypothetical protein
MFGNYTISESCGAANHVCQVNAYQTKDGRDLEPYEYFTDDESSSVKDSFLYTIICVALICSTGTLLHFIHKGSSKVWVTFYRDITIISVILLFLIFGFDYYMMGKETCLFPRWCHEGIDDKIIPAFYFYQMNECPRYSSWLTYYYEQMDTWNNGDDCESSEYGCCKVSEIECDASYREGDTYSRYELNQNYGGQWTLSVDKHDEEGSNCPTIEELIYQVSKNDKNNYLALYLSYTITTMIIMCLYMVCMKCTKKEDYEKTEIDDVEKTSEKGSV